MRVALHTINTGFLLCFHEFFSFEKARLESLYDLYYLVLARKFHNTIQFFVPFSRGFFSGDHILKFKSEVGKPLLNSLFFIFNLVIKVAFPRVFEIEKTERSGLESHFVERTPSFVILS